MQLVRGQAVGEGLVQAVCNVLEVVGLLGVGQRRLRSFEILKRWFVRAQGAVVGVRRRGMTGRQFTRALAQVSKGRRGVADIVQPVG
jgi:hypothetical protein